VADGGTYNATVKFPFKVYQWSLLVLRTLSFLRRVWAHQRYTSSPVNDASQQGTATRSVREAPHAAPGLMQSTEQDWVMVANKHDFKLAVRDIIARFQLDVPLGHCIAEKYVAEDDDAVDAAIREVVLMRL
jgi:hypothetical protein